MLKHYLSLSLKVFARRKFFTFVSLFGISFTLIVLMLVSALVDHAVAPFPPEVHQDRTLGIYFAIDVGRAHAAATAEQGSSCSTATCATSPASSACRSSATRTARSRT